MRNRKGSNILLNILLVVLILVGHILFTSCKKSEDAGPADKTQQNIEKAAGYTAATITALSKLVYDTALGIAGIDGAVAGNRAEGELTYDETTGWWSLSLTLFDTRNADIKVKFLDDSGNFHKYYGSETVRIDSTGQGSGANGSFTYTFVITGAGSSYSTYIVNGGGTSDYNGVAAAFTVSDMAITKMEDGYPENGEMGITVDEVTLTVTFNGSQYVQVTYAYKGFLYTVTINLLTGEIT